MSDVERGALTIRAAIIDDARLLWEWANDPVVRGNSFSPEPIAWADHLTWYSAKLGSPDCRIWIAVDGTPVGQVRYERIGRTAEVDVSVASAARGRGLGRLLLRETAALACRELGVPSLSALVLVANVASLRAFEAAGYRRVGPVTRRGREAIRLDRECGPA
jgi:RimJ/RimL family protein N-acetyltransferase